MKFREEIIAIKEEIRDLKQGGKVASTIECYQFRKLFEFTLPPSGTAATYRLQIKYAITNQPVISEVSSISKFNTEISGTPSSSATLLAKSEVQDNTQYTWCTVWNVAGEDPAPNKVYITVNSTAEVEDIVLALE